MILIDTPFMLVKKYMSNDICKKYLSEISQILKKNDKNKRKS